MRPIIYKDRQIVISKDLINTLLGILLVVAALALTGIFQFIEADFDFSVVKSPDFWAAYAFKLVMEYLAFFGVYILQKERDLKSPKILVQRERLSDEKLKIVKARKIDNFEYWLKNIYNLQIGVDRYRLVVEKRYARTKVKKPSPGKASKIALRRYERAETIRAKLKAELSLCDDYDALITARKTKDKNVMTALNEKINQINAIGKIRKYMPKITFGKLFNVGISDKEDDSGGIDYKEGAVVFKKIAPTIASGMIFTAVLASMLPPIFKNISAETLIFMGLMLFLLLWCMFKGLRTANAVVFGRIYVADCKRITICEKYREDNNLTE